MQKPALTTEEIDCINAAILHAERMHSDGLVPAGQRFNIVLMYLIDYGCSQHTQRAGVNAALDRWYAKPTA